MQGGSRAAWPACTPPLHAPHALTPLRALLHSTHPPRRGDAELVSGPAGERPAWWWTGRAPAAGAPGVGADGAVTSLPAPNLGTCSRQQALDYFDNTWMLTEVLFSALQGEGGAAGEGRAAAAGSRRGDLSRHLERVGVEAAAAAPSS